MSAMPRGVRRPLGEPGPLGRAWRWALAATGLSATIVASLFPLANATWEGRLEKDAARAPHVIAYAQDADTAELRERAVAYYDVSFADVDNRHVEIVWVRNLKPGASPPPGLGFWPGPHEVVASPGLLAASGGREFASRYGTLVGRIGDAGLVNPNERLLYAGIDPTIMSRSAGMSLIDGFGSTRLLAQESGGAVTPIDDGYLGDVLYQWNRREVFVVLALFAAAPCLILIGVTARLGGERRDQYAAWLSTLGASPRDIRCFLVREALVPISLGALTGLGLIGLAMTGNWQIPGFGAVIVGSYLRSAWYWCVMGAVAAVVFTLVTIVATNRVRRRSPTASPRAPVQRSRPWFSVVPVALIAAQSWLYAMLYPTDPGAAAVSSALATALLVVILAPCGGALVSLAGQVLSRAARRTSSPVCLVASRELSALPRPALRTCAVIAATIVIAVQAVLLLATPSKIVSDARMLADADPTLVVSAGSAQTMDDSWLQRGADGLPPEYAMFRLETSAEQGEPPILRITCDHIARFGADCTQPHGTFGQLLQGQPDASRRGYSDVIPLGSPVDTVPRLEGQPGDVMITSTTGQRLNLSRLESILTEVVSPVPFLTNQWSPWLTGARNDFENARWLLVAGLLAAAILLVASIFTLWFEVVRVARRMASLAMLMDRRRTADTLGISLVGIPIAVAALMGLLAALGISVVPTSVPGTEITMPWGYFLLVAALGTLLAVVAGILAGRVVRSYGSRWIPTQQDA